jgi:hypothetical protein
MNTGSSDVGNTVEDGTMGSAASAWERDLPITHPWALRLLTILWPAFLMAGVLEMLTFAVFDPAELRWFGGELIGWSTSAVYTVTFLIYWGVISVAGALTALLSIEGSTDTPARGLGRHWP